MATGNEGGIGNSVAKAVGINHAGMKKAGYARPAPPSVMSAMNRMQQQRDMVGFMQKNKKPQQPNVTPAKLPPPGTAQPMPGPSPAYQPQGGKPQASQAEYRGDNTRPENMSQPMLNPQTGQPNIGPSIPTESPVNAGIQQYTGPMMNSVAPGNGVPGYPNGPIPIQPPPGYPPAPQPGQPGAVPQDTENRLYQQWLSTQQGMFNPTAGGAGSSGSGGYSNPLDPQIQAVLEGQLANPSRYDMPLVRDTFDMLNRQLSEGYNTQANQVDEEMASRGLYNSTTAGGRLGDLRTNQARAQADMAQNLLMDQARTYSGDLNAATGAGMDFGRYGQGEDQRKFTNQAQVYGMNADQNQRAWQNYAGYGQQAFDNQMATANYNQNQDVINNQLLMQLLGGL